MFLRNLLSLGTGETGFYNPKWSRLDHSELLLSFVWQELLTRRVQLPSQHFYGPCYFKLLSPRNWLVHGDESARKRRSAGSQEENPSRMQWRI